VIENRPGADGLVAIQAFVAANDEPHAALHAERIVHCAFRSSTRKLPYTPADLVPIARISNTILGRRRGRRR